MTATSFSLAGKQVLVIGAASPTGAATASLCAQLGASVTVCGRDREKLAQVLDSLEGSGHGTLGAHLTGDFADPAMRQALVDALPVLDGCVFAGGSGGQLPVDALTQQYLDGVFGVNFYTPMLLTQALFACGKIRQGASLVYVTSAVQHWAFGGSSAHAASTAALGAAVRAIAVEHAGQGIRANCVAPGPVAPFPAGPAETGAPEPAPLGQVEACDVAAGIVYLLAPASRWVSRASLVIDAGLSLHVR